VPHWTCAVVVRWKIIVIKHKDSALNVIYGYRCNYSCVGCCNGSDYVKTTEFDPNIELTIQSVQKLSEYVDVDNSGAITLLGGDPFMYWHDRIVPLAFAIRKSFPLSKINIFTNGHLINRYIDDVIDLLNNLGNSCVTVSKHFQGDMQSVAGRKWLSNITEFTNNPKIIKISDNHYHVKDNITANIHFYQSDKWFTWYRQEPNGNIKPFATNNPTKSAKYGCASGISCSALFENRLYKCGSLAMLPGFLTAKNQTQDTDWKKYLDYPYVDILNIDNDKFNKFKSTYGKPIEHCDMCNDQPSNVIRWTERTQSMIL
jgi:organic radical activating enzyme